jgi:hypothetical protein
MVVIGSAVNYIDLFLIALRQVVEVAVHSIMTGLKYAVRSFSLDYHGIRHLITDTSSLPENIVLLSGQHILQNTVNSSIVKLSLNSPLRLLNNGSVMHHFDFSTFFRSQLRRCSSLFAYYGSGKLDLDFVHLSQTAQNITIHDEKIYYTRPLWSKRLNKSGLIGTVECLDLVEPMFSLLLLGSYFNAGKGATFGSGFHTIELID